MIRRLLFFLMWFVALPFLSLQAQSPGGVARTAEGDSTTAGNQSMRVVTFKAVPGTERTYYYHRDHLGSTTLITNESGEVVQRVEYLPTGETFIEQQDTCRGYVGIQGTAKELISLGKFFQEYIKVKGNSMKINFQIPNNPNYGNNGKANSNIGQ